MRLVPVRGLPMGKPTVTVSCALISLTVAGAVQGSRSTKRTAHLFPVSSAGRDRPTDTLPQQPDLKPGWKHYIQVVCVTRCKVMKDLHKRLLLLDAVENLPL